jgi:DMSO/TMAO reductase YedYZ molybdopterin-dependent catalytic subunit
VPSARFVSKEQKTMVNSRGFIERRAAWKNALTPGQYVTEDFPVLSADPTPHVPLEQWEFTIEGEDALRRRDWRAFASCRPAHPTDIHCVTGWPKLNTMWKGVSLDTFLNKVSGERPQDRGQVFSCQVGSVLMKHFASSETRPFSHPVFASAPVIKKTCLIGRTTP